MFKKNSALLLLLILGTLIFAPLMSLAGDYQADGNTIHYEGLVPCGKNPNSLASGESLEVGMPCQFCHLFVMFDAALDFIFFQITPPIAVLMIVIGGIMFFSSAGDPGKVQTAKKLLTSVILGIVLIYTSWLLLSFFFSIIGVSDWTGLKEGWFQMNCDIKY